MKVVLEKDCSISLGEYSVISDLHLGYERTLEKKGYFFPKQYKKILERVKKLKKDRLIIIGDLKERIIGSHWAIEEFLGELKKRFREVIVVKGNHDALIERIHDSVFKELKIGNVLLIHGHSIPKEVGGENIIIVGHIHPTHSYTDGIGVEHKMRCWWLGKWKDREMIVMPAFNELVGRGNENSKRGIFRYFEKKEVLLLDLTKVI